MHNISLMFIWNEGHTIAHIHGEGQNERGYKNKSSVALYTPRLAQACSSSPEGVRLARTVPIERPTRRLSRGPLTASNTLHTQVAGATQHAARGHFGTHKHAAHIRSDLLVLGAARACMCGHSELREHGGQSLG